MKKFMYLLSVAALAMASCSNSDDPIAEQSSPKLASADQLLIRPAIGGASTRAYDDAASLQTTGFSMVMTGSFVNDDGTGKPGTTAYDTSGTKTVTYAGSAWSLSDVTNPLWWADATTKATFAAYAPSATTIGSEFEVAAPLAQNDYVVAYNEGVKADFKSGVPLNFQHVTSQIVVKAKNLNTTAVTIKVKATRLVNVVSKGTLSLPTVATNGSFSWASYTPWALGTSTATYKDTYDASPVTLEESNAQVIGQSQYLLPQQLAAATTDAVYQAGEAWDQSITGNAIAFLIQVSDADGAIYPVIQTGDTEQGYAWAYVPVDTNWEPGKKYIYTINFTENAYGKIDPDQGDGGTDDPTDPTPGTDDPTDPTPQPGDEVVDDDVALSFTVTVADWEDVEEAKNL